MCKESLRAFGASRRRTRQISHKTPLSRLREVHKKSGTKLAGLRRTMKLRTLLHREGSNRGANLGQPTRMRVIRVHSAMFLPQVFLDIMQRISILWNLPCQFVPSRNELLLFHPERNSLIKRVTDTNLNHRPTPGTWTRQQGLPGAWTRNRKEKLIRYIDRVRPI